MTKLLAILGGTFDPVHIGHVQIAKQLLRRLPCDEIRFVPCKQPVLKASSSATVEQRLTMLKLALQDHPELVIDERELHRDGPSYMIDTLRSLRDEFPDTPLALILGMDAFLELPRWHQWQSLLELSHLTVINRKDAQLPDSEPLASLIKQHQLNNLTQLPKSLAGHISFVELPLIDISSTQLRKQLSNGQDCSQYLDPSIVKYIKSEHLYR